MYVILIIPCSLGLGGLAGGRDVVGHGHVVECGLAPPAIKTNQVDQEIKHYCGIVQL